MAEHMELTCLDILINTQGHLDPQASMLTSMMKSEAENELDEMLCFQMFSQLSSCLDINIICNVL